MNLNPLNARTLEDLERMQHDYEAMYQRQKQLESIPYSNRRLSDMSAKLSSSQQEISDEMSKYGSTLLPALIGCGAAGCLGVTAYVVDKYLSNQPKIKKEPGPDYKPIIKPKPNQPPIYIDLTKDDDDYYIPQTPNK